ncbi:MAG: hypothetical protein AAB521_00385 [Patescibacteria group bacterium]
MEEKNQDSLQGYILPFSFTPKAKLLLGLALFLIVLTIIPLSVLLTKNNKQPASTSVKNLPSQLKDSGANAEFISTYQGNLKDAILLDGVDKEDYKKIYNIVQGISLEYSKTHNPKLRELISEIGEYAKVNIPSQYKQNDFVVLCSDEKCGKLEYDPQLNELKDGIEKSNLGTNKKTILDALYDASIVSSQNTEAEKNRKNDNLLFAYDILKTEEEKGSSTAGEFKNRLLEYLEKITPGITEKLNKPKDTGSSPNR